MGTTRSIASILLMCASLCAASPAPLVRGFYRVLPGGHREKQPFDVVTFTYGPAAPDGGCAWELEARAEEAPGSVALFRLRCTTSRDPLAPGDAPLEFLRYALRAAGSDQALEYRDAHTGNALLPGWEDFARNFIPRPARGTGRQGDLPNTCEYLGHVLTLRSVSGGARWDEWKDVKVLELDPELLVGTGRTFKDAEGHRLPQTPERRNYTYVQWTLDDYRTMIEAGMTIFGLAPASEDFVRSQPVFYRRGGSGLAYPADLYRSNFTGPMMYMDEPTCIMVGDQTVNTALRFFTDAAALIEKRVRSLYGRGVYGLEKELRDAGISFGDMRLAQHDFASWETRYETAFYQLAGGGAGFVHEGRYGLDEFNEFARASTGFDRTYTPSEMFRYYYAFMRGAARHFGKRWGTSIYGQADPAISPLAVTMAYDMGARYIWFWTSDHDHHLPWNEQLELARLLARHAASHPRPSIRGPAPVLEKAIVIPYGYFLVLESPTNRRNCWDLWWVREMDAQGRNEASRRYRRLVQQAFVEVRKSLDAGEEFDFTVDDGRPIEGYRRIVRLSPDSE